MIRPASTLLLLRDEAEGFSVFMIERSRASRFMGGAYVFPGGRVEDYDGEVLPGDAVAHDRLVKEGVDPERAAGHLAAARRELTEESLVTLPSDVELQAFAHWLTPEVESRRFDTWFFVARLPAGMEPAHDDHEAVMSRWVNPREATDGDGTPRLPLPPPTYHSLWDLSRFDTAEAALADAAVRPLPPCLPSLRELDDGPAIILPGDPMHPSERPMHGPSRLHLGGGDAWWAVQNASRNT